MNNTNYSRSYLYQAIIIIAKGFHFIYNEIILQQHVSPALISKNNNHGCK